MAEDRAKEIAYSAKQEVKDEIRAKLDGHSGRRSFPLSTNQYSQGNWVRSIREPSSPSSASLASLDLAKERAEEEMEMSQMRSRSTARTKRTSEEIVIKTNETPSRKSRREVLHTIFFL